MIRVKKTKIVCTIGPSSWDPQILQGLIDNGMNVARINGAFADVDELKRVGDSIKKLSSDVALMLDIKGHEVRLNKFDEPLLIKKGDEIVLGQKGDRLYPATYPELYKDIAVGQVIIIDKGSAKLEVVKIKDKQIICKVINGNEIKRGKGMNFPNAKLKNPPLTNKDVEQINLVIQEDWDFIAASFIRNKNDALEVKRYLNNTPLKLIAKIEDQQGVDNFDDILSVSDGIMIARGDMGTEIAYERLPIIQKQLIYRCNRAAKPVIVATNMLESMIENIFPTRAEITDVANAVLDGTDSIMTSGETSSGKFPVESVETMAKIAKENEKYLSPEIIEPFQLDDMRINVAIANAAYEMLIELDEINKIIVYTRTGVTARIISRLNLPVKIYALVASQNIKRQLDLTKSVWPYVLNKFWIDRDQAIKDMVKFGLEQEFLDKNDKILLIGNTTRAHEKEVTYPNIFEYIEVENYLDKDD